MPVTNAVGNSWGSEVGCWGFVESSSFWESISKGMSLFFGGSTNIVTVLTPESEKDVWTFAEKIKIEKRSEKPYRNIRWVFKSDHLIFWWDWYGS